ncbi:MAG: hypothetical protein HDQ88_08715 [Clostridia bacterium]|nr:hypothetical protein [Clostridia bacterium]
MVYVPDPPYGQNNQWAPELPQGSAHAYNEICYPHISLWSDVKIYQGYDCSYLAWDESEKAYEMGVWFEFLVNLLTKMGYACKGIVKAQGENDDDRWTVVCEDGTVKIDDSHDKAPTYEKELHEIKSRLATIWE